MAFVTVSIVVLLLLLRRRNFHRKNSPSFIDARGEDGHSIHLLLQQQQHQQGRHGAQTGMQPDLIRGGNSSSGGEASGRGGGGDKMQLISRLNNFDSNIVEHLVIRNEHLMSNQSTLEKQSGQGAKASIPGTAFINNNRNNHHGSCASVNALVTPLHQRHQQQQQQQQQQYNHHQQQVLMISSPANTNEEQSESYSEAGSEPDYAEPVITSSSSFTPERKPPLPKSFPPNQRQPFASSSLSSQADVLRTKPVVEVLPSKKMPRSANRPPRSQARCSNKKSSVDSSSLSS